MTSQPYRPLSEVVAQIPDPRHARGKRHPLSAILCLVCAATLCGCRGCNAMAEWGRNHGEAIVAALGFTQGAPCAATLHRVLGALDRARVEAVLGAWAEEVLAALPPRRGQPAGLSLDGKTLRGSRKQGAPGTHRTCSPRSPTGWG